MIKFEKSCPSVKIWWIKDPETGEVRFSFDRKKTYSVWNDYPHKMTPKEVTIFDAENPVWAKFFECRKEKKR